MAVPRPMFLTMWHHFITIYGDGSVSSVGKNIGGKVQYNIERIIERIIGDRPRLFPSPRLATPEFRGQFIYFQNRARPDNA